MCTKRCFVIMFAMLCVVAAEDIERDFINVLNEMDNEKSIYLFGGLSVEKVDGGARSAPATTFTDNVVERAERYLDTHELKFNYPEEEITETTGRSQRPTESRTRKLKKIILPLLLALKLKLALVVKLFLVAIKVISLKGLAAGFLALILAGASFFKDMLAGKKDHVTAAYITGHPIHAEVVHSDWNRNGQASAQELAYNYHAMPQATY